MPFGLLSGLGAAMAWGILETVSALASRRIGSIQVTAGVVTVSAAWCVLVGIVAGAGRVIGWDAIAVSALLGVAGTAAYLTYFAGLRSGPISAVSGMVGAYGGLTVVLSVVIRGESLTAVQAAGSIIATIGVVLIAVAFGGGIRGMHFAGPGVALAAVALVLFSLMAIMTDVALEIADVVQVLVISRVTTALTAVVALLIERRRSSDEQAPPGRSSDRVEWRVLGAIALAGTLDVLGLASFTVGLELAPTWIVGLASSFAPAVTILIAITILGERLRPIQWWGLAGVALGVVAIALP